MRRSLFFTGVAIWAVATVILRVAGQRWLRPDHPIAVLVLFALSFPLMALLVRRLCVRFRLPADEWPAGAISVVLPTLLLDPFSSAYFHLVFPNMAPEMAGPFGGWMLICCAGGLAGVLKR